MSRDDEATCHHGDVTAARASSSLRRLLAYDGATRDDGPAQMVAPEILRMACWTPEFCAALVEAADAVGVAADPHDPVPGEEVSLARISPVLFAHVERDMGTRIWPLITAHWPLAEYRGINDAFVIRYEPGRQESLRLHHDVAQVSGSVRLNDGYQGAVLEFPRQSFDTAQIPVGDLVVWPSLVTHPHQGTPIRSGVKYALTIWFELPISLDG